MNTLFPLRDDPSPRLLWIRKHDIRPHFSANSQPPWSARIGKDLPDDLEANLGLGETQDDAIADLARKKGLKLWNEE